MFIYQCICVCPFILHCNKELWTAPLNPSLLSEVGLTAGSAAVAAELRKHSANDTMCSELGWTCIPLVVEAYGAWGREAVQLSQDLLHTLPQGPTPPSPRWSLTSMAA